MFDLTQDERRALAFLAVVVLAGAGIHLYFKRSAQRAGLVRAQERLSKVDINSADKALLDSVPGIGARTAQRIIDRRQAGRFENVDQLREVEGVSDYRFNQMKEFLSAQ
jgi:competence ComEA-like helix-hairpin-helix protein